MKNVLADEIVYLADTDKFKANINTHLVANKGVSPFPPFFHSSPYSTVSFSLFSFPCLDALL